MGSTTVIESSGLWEREPVANEQINLNFKFEAHLIAGMEIARWLTPFDWAVSALLRRPDIEGWSINIRPASDYDLDALRKTVGYRVWKLTSLMLPEVLVNGKLPDGIKASGSVEDRRTLLRGMWRAEILSQSNDKHAISNLIGAQLLAGGSDSAFAPMKTLLSSLGLWSATLSAPAPLEALAPNPDVSAYVLIDDLEKLGWADYLRNELGKDRIHAHDRLPSGFLERLENALNNPSAELLEQLARPVLLLDLRLFSRTSFGRECDMFRSLLKLVPDARSPDSFGDANQIEGFLNTLNAEGGTSSPTYRSALTLLPRLIAAARPRMPIVIFSSTGRREVIDAFRLHRNIITDFEKPRIDSSEPEEAVESTHHKLRTALGRAHHLIDADVRLEKIRQMAQGISRPEAGYVELFLDESGCPVNGQIFAYGGVAACYPSKPKQDSLKQVFEEHQIVFGRSRECQLPDAPKYAVKKRPSSQRLAEITGRLLDALKGSNVQLVPFCWLENSRPDTVSGLIGNHSEEHHRRVLRNTLEFGLFDLLNCTSFGVEVDERSIPYGRTIEEAKAYAERFGVRASSPSKGPMIKVLEKSSVWSEVNAVCVARKPSRDVQGAIARSLFGGNRDWFGEPDPKGKKPPLTELDKLPRTLHYFADWVVGWLSKYTRFGNKNPDVISKFIVTGPVCSSFSLLKSTRFGDNGDHSAALAMAATSLPEPATPKWEKSHLKWVSPRLTEWMESDTFDFHDYAELLEDNLRKAGNPKAPQ